MYEVYARDVHQSGLFGFIEIEDLVFGEKTSLVVDPSAPPAEPATARGIVLRGVSPGRQVGFLQHVLGEVGAPHDA